MTSIRVFLFLISFLGLLYGLLSITNTSKTDVLAGMLVASLGVLGWVLCEIWEELR